MKKKKILYVLIALIVVGLLTLASLYSNNNVSDKKDDTEEETEVVEEEVDEELLALKKLWQENKAINDDYVGEVYFDSKLIDQSFVQATSVYDDNGQMYTFYNENGSLATNPNNYTGNDVYIWTYWKTGEYDYNDHGGSVFMDYRNSLDDQNIVIYGHHFSEWNDLTRQKSFTPLEKLLDEANYTKGDNLNVVLENEIRKYELVCVYEFNYYDDNDYYNCQYWRTSYNYDDYTGVEDENYYASYIEAIKQRALYDTGTELTTDDRTITLQTCISGYTGVKFEILVFKQTDTITY